MVNLNPPEDVVAEIDRRGAAAAAAPQDVQAMDALWRALYGLERWIFLDRGEPDDPRPYALAFPQGPMVLAFTTSDRAQAAGRANGLSDDDVRRMLALPLPGAIEWVAGLAGAGIVGVLFDRGVVDAYAPLGNLLPMRDWMAANPIA